MAESMSAASRSPILENTICGRPVKIFGGNQIADLRYWSPSTPAGRLRKGPS